MERYVTFVGLLEGFSDLRRTLNEPVGVKITPISGTSMPLRLAYPQSEVNANASVPQPLPGLFDPTPVNQ